MVAHFTTALEKDILAEKRSSVKKKILHLYFLRLTSSLFHVSFISRVNINSTNWPATNV